MKDHIRKKLDKIDELFPEERLRKSKERWGRLWNNQPCLDRQPFCFYPITLSYYNDVDTKEERLIKTLDEIIYRGKFEDDFIPSIFPGCRQGTIPNMFGAKEVVLDGDYSSESIITQASDIDALPEPSMNCKLVNHWLEMQEYFLQETEGRIPIHVIDMQGPLDVAGNLFKYDEILLLAYVDEARYRKLMDKICTAFMMLWDAQYKLLGDAFIGTHLFGWSWKPPGFGVSLSADVLAMISCDFYENYYESYINKIATYYGGLSIHSCGDFSQTIKRLSGNPNIKAVHAGQMTSKSVFEAGFYVDKVLITSESIDNIDQIVSLVKQHNINLDLTLHDFWPEKNGVRKHPRDWTTEDICMMHKNNEIILDKLQVV